jgi:mannan endo-1,6-alpha-mannosidase
MSQMMVGYNSPTLNLSLRWQQWLTEPASVKNAASTIALDLMSYYTATQPGSKDPIGFFPTYWWEAGAVWGALIDYWHYTGDASYNHDVGQALVSQLSPTNDFMPTNVQSQEVCNISPLTTGF